MKSILVAAALLAVPSFILAEDATRPYLVGTRRPAHEAARRILNDDLEPRAGRDIQEFDIVDAIAVRLTDDEAMKLRRSASVSYVEPDMPRYAFALPTNIPTNIQPNELRNPNGQTTPYGIPLIHADSLWAVPSGRGNGINVAVLDTGIDFNHPDLKDNYAGGFNTFAGENINTPTDDAGHGTHVAGTVAATDNSFGVIGVAPSAKLWVVRVLKSDGKGSASGPTSNIVNGIQYVVNQKKALGGNWIISMSLGSCFDSTTERNAINTAVANGILVVVAAGNHDSTTPDVCSTDTQNSYSVSYPAAYPGVLAIAAVDSRKIAADFSNIGPEVAVAAAGVDVLSTKRLGTGSISSLTVGTQRSESVALTGSPTGTITGKLVDCALGKVGEFPASVSGNIALIKRGDITFNEKAVNAKAAGAKAVLVYNRDESALNFTLGTPPTSDYVFPLSVAISLSMGQALAAQSNLTATVVNEPDDYGMDSGTSMACPHVAGVAALVWGLAPQKTADQVKDAIKTTARDLGAAGFDNIYGNGLVDAFAAAVKLAPNAFPSSGRKILKRGGH
jgi:subtilisin family serine protease